VQAAADDDDVGRAHRPLDAHHGLHRGFGLRQRRELGHGDRLHRRAQAVVAHFLRRDAALAGDELRHREPATERPYRVWGFPWTTGIVLVGSLAFLLAAVSADTRHALYSIALLAVSYPVYRILKQRILST